MKRCDLHIHTVSSISDKPFDYDENVLLDYVKSSGLDVIAITNHNLFDYFQFLRIKELLRDTIVLPGVEVDLEGGHIIVIANNDDNALLEFNAQCGDVNRLICSATDSLSYDSFTKIFTDLRKYILIPHYDKSPELHKDIIEKLGQSIICGEVSSVKKFIYMKKDEAERLTPLLFSDFRAEKGALSKEYPVSHTFLEIDKVTVNSLRICLMDKTNASLSENNGCELFQVFPNGQMLSTGLNILLGKRSTGKTYTLNAIAKKYGEKAKYIKQFELQNKGDDNLEQFEYDTRRRQEKSAEAFFSEFRYVVEDMLDINLAEEDDLRLQEYLNALKSYARQCDLNDVYSKATFFNETNYKLQGIEEEKRLINAVKLLLDTHLYKSLIEQYIPRSSLAALLRNFIEIYRSKCLDNSYYEEVNNVINGIKSSLQLKSAAPRIPELDLYQLLINERKRVVFTKIANSLKTNRTISTEQAGNFKVRVSSRRFNNATDLKSVGLKQVALAKVFTHYDEPIRYLKDLADSVPENEKIYRLFAAVDYEILNSSGMPVSGGERSEFNFLQKIKDAYLCDILIIDEPESSFDNIFLKNEINKFIKEMAERMPVIISTHNNTIGGSIKPDYILYTEKVVSGGEAHFNIYSGFPEAKYLADVNGKQIANYKITLNSLEAGEEAYRERKEIYEALKD